MLRLIGQPPVAATIYELYLSTSSRSCAATCAEADLEIPLPASTQWEIVSAAAPHLKPVSEELIRQAAQGEVLHNDDTKVRILELMGERAKQESFDESDDDGGGQRDPPERTGLFTSGVVAISGGERIALFFSGRQQAGENLRDVLRQRLAEAPIRRAIGGTQLGVGRRDQLPAKALNELQRHTDEVAAAPAGWLPWNYRQQLAAA